MQLRPMRVVRQAGGGWTIKGGAIHLVASKPVIRPEEFYKTLDGREPLRLMAFDARFGRAAPDIVRAHAVDLVGACGTKMMLEIYPDMISVYSYDSGIASSVLRLNAALGRHYGCAFVIEAEA